MPGQGDELLKPEQQKSAEKYSQYDRVILGHPFSAIDQDQIFAVYFAQKLGFIKPSAEIIAVPFVEDKYINDPNSLIFEGFNQKNYKGKVNIKQTNLFHNSLTDEVQAAGRFLNEKNPDRKNLSENYKTLQDLSKCLYKADNHKQNNFDPERIDIDNFLKLSTIFAAYRAEFYQRGDRDPRKYLDRCFEVIDKVIELGKRGDQKIDDFYSAELSAYQPIKAQELSQITELTKDPEHFDYTVTPEGIKIGFLSCTSLENPIDIGGPNAVKNRVAELTDGDQPNIIVIFNSERDEIGKITGTKVYIDYNNYKADNLEDLLESRLNYLESLYGKGFDIAIKRGFGGHKYHVLSSPQFLGTSLDENSVKYLLESFFEIPRFTSEKFEQKAKDVASLVGVENFFPLPNSSPDNQWRVPEPIVELSIFNQDGHLVKVKLSESDLPVYEKLLSEMPAEKRQKWLLGKTEFNEPKEVVALREKQALEALQIHLTENRPLKLLSDLNKINSSSIRKLPLGLRLQVLEEISMSQESIAKVFDLKDTQYRISIKYLPNWLLDNPAEYQGARYNYESLPKKVDTALLDSVREGVLVSKNSDQQRKYADCLLAIINSDAYKSTRGEKVYDHVVETALQYASDERLPKDISEQLLSNIPQEYIEKSRHNLDELRRVGGVRNSFVENPDQTELKSKLAEERLRGETPCVNLVLDLGRGSRDHILESGFIPLGEEEISPMTAIDGEVRIEGALDLFRGNEQQEAYSSLITKKFVSMIKDSLEATKDIHERKLRIVLASGPLRVSRSLTTKLFLEYISKSLVPADLLALNIVEFNMTTNQYEEIQFLSGEDRETFLEFISP